MKDARQLLSELDRVGVDLHLWLNRVVLPKGNRIVEISKTLQRIQTQISTNHDDLRTILVGRLRVERERLPEDHAWIIRLGDRAKTAGQLVRPAFLACGSREWCQRVISKAAMFEEAANRYRWILLERSQVGAITGDERGRLVAGLLKLPDGVDIGGPRGSRAQILSACRLCIKFEEPKADETR